MKITHTIIALSLLSAVAVPAYADRNQGNTYKSSGQAQEMWKKSDTNSDGFISENEFLEKKREWFKKMDKNSDGRIDQQEHTAAMNMKHDKMES